MAEDWSVDVRKYVPNADPGVIAGIVRYCGIALHNRDSSLVSFSDKTETDRVRENFLKKKLGLTASDADLDAAIATVGETMKADHTKNRVTVYYLLAERFGKLGLFNKSLSSVEQVVAAEESKGAGIAGAAALGAAGLGAAGLAAGRSVLGSGAEAARVAGEGLSSAAAPLAGGVAAAEPFAGEPLLDAPAGGSGLMRWLPWLVLAAALLALLLYLWLHKPAPAPQVASPVVSNEAVETPAAPAPTTEAPAPAVAIPTGAGVTTETRDGKPAVIVYFDTGKADVVPAFAAAAGGLKTYLDANPGSKLTVSGFNDKTGNAALNAELSKNRAKAVQTALEAVNIPTGSIVLAKPADTTDTSTTNAQARRVEVVAQ